MREGSFRLARVILAGLLVCLSFGRLYGEEAKPEEYQSSEFSPWMRKLRRGETILLGSLPFSVFLTSFGYDLYRFADHFQEEQRSSYAPWPFRGADAVPYSTSENVGVMVGALATSLFVALADLVIGEIRERRAKVSSSGP